MTQTASAPFTPAQVAALEWLQRGRVLQPYRCEGPFDAAHSERLALVAGEDGLRCGVCGWVRTDVPAAVLAFAAERVGGERPRAAAGKKGRGRR